MIILHVDIVDILTIKTFETFVTFVTFVTFETKKLQPPLAEWLQKAYEKNISYAM